MKRLLLCAVLVVGMAGPAAAVFLSGNHFQDANQLLAKCQGDIIKHAVCLDYVEGVVDTLVKFRGRTCIPPSVIAKQVMDITVAWIKANPSKRHFSASTVVVIALSEAFPCKK